jgi:hypothetical protein
MEEIVGFHRDFTSPLVGMFSCDGFGTGRPRVSILIESLHDKIAVGLHLGKVDIMPIDAKKYLNATIYIFNHIKQHQDTVRAYKEHIKNGDTVDDNDNDALCAETSLPILLGIC